MRTTRPQGVTNGSIVTAAWVLSMVVAGAGSAVAQPAPAQAPAAGARRENLRMMEGVLTNAVKNGADSLGRQMQLTEPGSLIVTGTARARGFALDGYGAFFVVDVPMMKQSVVWSAQVLLREQRREFLRQLVANTPTDNPRHREAEIELRKLDRPNLPVPSVAAPSPVSTQPAPGTATAQSLPETVDPSAVGSDPRDPNELYTEAVKTALIDAMLNFGSSLIGPDEWLTVAAADSEGPATPGQFYDASTIVLRVKGSDLGAYHAKQLTKEEVLKKVEIREF